MAWGGRQLFIERRLKQPWWLQITVPALSVVAALTLGALFLALQGYNPASVYRDLFKASFTTYYGLTDSLALAVPLILTGTAAAVVFRMNVFNIGAEGQLYVGAIFGSWAGLVLTAGLAKPLAITIVLLAGSVGGALWALPAAVAKVQFGTSEIISTLMLNFVALYLMRYLIFGSKSLWRDPESTNFPQGLKIAENARFESWGSSRLHTGLIVAIAIAVLIWLLIRFTSVGYAMTVVGHSPTAATYAGISAKATTLLALLISGGLGGLAGAVEITGRAYSLDPNGLELGLGFTGIVVAALARYNPWAVIMVAFLLGGVRNAGVALQTAGERVPLEVSLMLQGAILLFAVGAEVLIENRLRWQSVESASDNARAL